MTLVVSKARNPTKRNVLIAFGITVALWIAPGVFAILQMDHTPFAQAYAEVIKYPAPANKALGYAWYKTAFVFWNKGELDKALNAFKKTVEFGVTHATLVELALAGASAD